jgi:hypothetical protein
MVDLVTITGADDTTEIQQLMDLSAEFPFVEWGILVSKRQEGSRRFPSRAWINGFLDVAFDHDVHISTHLCGAWVQQLFLGTLKWEEVPRVAQVGERIQINTHAESYVASDLMKKSFENPMVAGREFIVQWDGVNGHRAHSLAAYTPEVSVLYDLSGGAGILPDTWPKPHPNFYCGYAGGLGPNNVVEQLKRIEESARGRHYWIDMERRVRNADDSRLDMEAVRSVLQQVASVKGR